MIEVHHTEDHLKKVRRVDSVAWCVSECNIGVVFKNVQVNSECCNHRKTLVCIDQMDLQMSVHNLAIIWATSSKFDTYHLCEQRRFRRACASAQSRQNLRFSLKQAGSQEEPSDWKPDPWTLWFSQSIFFFYKCLLTELIMILRIVISLHAGCQRSVTSNSPRINNNMNTFHTQCEICSGNVASEH